MPVHDLNVSLRVRDEGVDSEPPPRFVFCEAAAGRVWMPLRLRTLRQAKYQRHRRHTVPYSGAIDERFEFFVRYRDPVSVTQVHHEHNRVNLSRV
eukprot:CAMPEP_0172608832 /NCGR_PEP_ID=MMETSP1068-20121228/28889_1 /TAXON_ID=35684 /ORGANISM="Pseudopedinella elastica, Strain CCMP716" /LENGTH=94 /DNA_ID=CAMNT_0013412205 /DNA_START=200 /DNA_END=484 /DNA_ORIENTATION=-